MKSIRQMSVLCVGNGALAVKEDGFYENQDTARFLMELGEDAGLPTWCQFVVDFVKSESLANYNLSCAGNVRLLPLTYSNSSKITKLFSYLRALPKLIKEIKKADCLYLFFPGNLSFLCGVLAIIIRKPYGVYLRGIFSIDRKPAHLILSKASFVITTGSLLCPKIREICCNVEVVTPMLGLTTDDIKTVRNHRTVGPWKILFVGRVEKRKGVGELIEAANKLMEKGFDFELQIVGGGPQINRYKTTLPVNLMNCIRFFGTISDRKYLYQLYQQADLFVLPSYDEGFPRVLYEAMAFGLPIITTFVGNIPSLMVDSVNSIRIDAGDSEAIASQIVKLLKDVELRKSLSMKARMDVEKVILDWDKSHAKQLCDKLMTQINDRA